LSIALLIAIVVASLSIVKFGLSITISTRFIIASLFDFEIKTIDKKHENAAYTIFEATGTKKTLFGLINKKFTPIAVFSNNGIPKLKINQGKLIKTEFISIENNFKSFIDQYSAFSDVGQVLPKVYLVFNHKILDLTGVTKYEQMEALIKEEKKIIKQDDQVYILISLAF